MLSVAIIAKNEEQHITRCLESVKQIADEIVVVDTGSTDSTKEIALQYTDKVFEHPWENSFSIARNQSIDYCTQDWILLLDCDEELPEETQKALKPFLAGLSEDVNTIYMTCVNWLDYEKTLHDTVKHVRLFRNGTGHFVNRIHNQPVTQEKNVYFDKPLYHYGYIWTDEIRARKHTRTKTLILEQLKDELTVKLRHYYEIQLYKTELIGNFAEEAFAYGKTIFDGIKQAEHKDLPAIAYEYGILMGLQSMDYQDFELAKEYFQFSLGMDKDCPDGYMGMAMYYMNIHGMLGEDDDLAEGLKNANTFYIQYQKFLGGTLPFTFTVVSTKYIDIMHMTASMLYAKAGNSTKAIDYLMKVNYQGLLREEIGKFVIHYVKLLSKDDIPVEVAAKIFEVLEPHAIGNISPLEYRLQKEGIDITTKRKKIAIICESGKDHLVRPIFEQLNKDYICRLLLPSSAEDIRRIMDWADIVWFEWASAMTAACINEPKKEGQKWILRVISQEVLDGIIPQVNFSKVDKVIFVAEEVLKIAKQISAFEDEPTIIHNGVDTDKFNYRERQGGYHIAFAGSLNYKKNPELILQIMYKLVQENPQYKFFWAGKYDDVRTMIYMEHMIKEMGLSDNVLFEQWQDDVDKWLDDKDYYLSTSIWETYGYSIIEAMAKGIKPIVHHFVGAKDYYPENILFNTVDEAVNMIKNGYDSKFYREVAESKNFAEQMNRIKEVIERLR